MIRRLVLRNWRAYESADIGFEPGTTFVVAPNGVGKTSLLEAARWAICGDAVALPDMPVRLPAKSAEVTVTVQLPEARILKVRRELTAGTKPTTDVEATVAGEPLDEDELADLVEREWGASLEFLGRGAFLTETFRRAPEDRDLRGQLCRVFGVTELEADAERLGRELVVLQNHLRDLGRSARNEAADTARLDDELSEAERLAAAAASRLDEARAAFDAVSSARDARRVFAERRDAVARWDAALQPLVAAAAELVESPTPANVREQLDAAVEVDEARLEELRRERATLEARAGILSSGLGELDTAGDECPVCRRPLDEEDREAARRRHAADLAAIDGALGRLDDTVVAGRVAALRSLASRVRELGPRPEPGVEPPADLLAADTDAVDEARARLEDAAGSKREADGRVENLRTTIRDLRAADEVSRELVAGHRQWALIEAARRSLAGTVDELLHSQISPLASLVAERWNRLFANRPDLRVDPTGRLWRDIAGAELPYSAFSAGEQTAARLLLQLVVLTSATTARFCWVDEPLEHLDPTTRRLVAGMLSRGKRATGLNQLVVTTYEEDLARRLAAADDATHVLYVRAGGDTAPA
ncbi:MAG: AAA family ATPase [Actinomycetota bacterium]|nr:AAA family ATPase [Actinomycetota bacterium]